MVPADLIGPVVLFILMATVIDAAVAFDREELRFENKVLETMAPAQIPLAIQYDDEGEVGGFIVAEPFGANVVKAGLQEK